eukprot:scaffold873_cov393-Prasinococcus_capsulatus_cf.AAC.2
MDASCLNNPGPLEPSNNMPHSIYIRQNEARRSQRVADSSYSAGQDELSDHLVQYKGASVLLLHVVANTVQSTLHAPTSCTSKSRELTLPRLLLHAAWPRRGAHARPRCASSRALVEDRTSQTGLAEGVTAGEGEHASLHWAAAANEACPRAPPARTVRAAFTF